MCKVLTGCHACACRVHALCAALRPDIQPLASHSSYSSCSHFAYAVRRLEVHARNESYAAGASGAAPDPPEHTCVVQGDGSSFGNLRAVFAIFSSEVRSDAAASAMLATAACCSQRLDVLRERLLRLHFTCPLVVKAAPGLASSSKSAQRDDGGMLRCACQRRHHD